jgi:UDP-N-acetylglucosamine--N-acetylmuramyl-(pentapeptide) pyrophosphoryl-undecaprenol N-acetylglucosamine transferase
MMAPLVLMMAGGTGGHVYPALAVATELLERGYRVEWVGTTRGLEARVVPGAGIELHHLAVRGVRGKGLLAKVGALVSLALASLQAFWLVLRRAPKLVVGMGGYVAGPAGVAAWLLRKPLLIHEQNAVAGTTNRMLAPFATRIAAGFDGAFAPGVAVTVLGNPVRRALVEAGRNAQYDYDGQRPLRLLVVGGSLGAQAINAQIPLLWQQLEAGTIELWHQTGEAHHATVAAQYGQTIPAGVRVVPFIEDMQAAYAWADLVVCRAGALTVAELAIMGRPAVLVPLPHAIDDHQSANARALTSVGAAVLMPQAQFDATALAAQITAWKNDPAALRAMAQASRDSAIPDAAARVSDLCEELLND